MPRVTFEEEPTLREQLGSPGIYRPSSHDPPNWISAASSPETFSANQLHTDIDVSKFMIGRICRVAGAGCIAAAVGGKRVDVIGETCSIRAPRVAD